jgi:hypothetical protein
MNYDQREHAIHTKFVIKMGKLYGPPNNIKHDRDAQQVYSQELRRAINSRLPTNINDETFDLLLDKVWDKCVQDNTYRVWFLPATVSKVAAKISADFIARQKALDAKFNLTYEGQEKDRPKGDKSKPETMGWTIEKCDEHIAMTKQMMKDKKLNIHMGNVLIRIPMKAKERLIKSGQTE